jgi:hypothetical protein
MGRALRRLPGLVAAVAAGAAAVGLLARPSGPPVSVTTSRGQTAQLAGDGLYRYDSVFTAWNNTAVDAVVLAFGIPLVVRAWLQHRDGSPRGTLLLTGSLGYLLYVYANYALGVAYNPLYLAYVTLLSASLFGVVAAFREMNRAALTAVAADPRVPHRTLAWYLLGSAVVTAVVWLQPLVTALVQRRAPELLDVYTTTVTYSLDLAVIIPAAALAGLLVLGQRLSPTQLGGMALVVLASALVMGAGQRKDPAATG